MSQPALNLCIPRPGQPWTAARVEALNPCLERLSAEERVRWALDFLPSRHVLTSSFGAQSAAMLHLVTRASPGIQVLVIDTGYLFPETYRFIDALTERLSLNLEVVRAPISPGWLEARHGRLWESGAEGIRRYNDLAKVQPLRDALQRLQAGTWISGLRRSQSDTRRDIGVLQASDQAVKVHPIADWTNRDLHRYLKAHDLPYHPLWEQGYVSIGDWHTSRPLGAGMEERDTRFFGLVRECGIHQL